MTEVHTGNDHQSHVSRITYHNFAGVLGTALVLVGDLDGGDGEAVLHVDRDNLALLGGGAVSVTGVLAGVRNVSWWERGLGIGGRQYILVGERGLGII